MSVHRYEIGGLEFCGSPHVIDHESGAILYYAGCVSRLNEYEARVREMAEVIKHFEEDFTRRTGIPYRVDHGDPTNAVEFLKTIVRKLKRKSRKPKQP